MSTILNNPAGVTLKGGKAVSRYLTQSGKTCAKAMTTAVRVEGFRLKKQMQADIRKGAPGGRQLAPLSAIAKRMQRKVQGEGAAGIRQSPNRKPLARLALAVRYAVASVSPFTMAVGFVDHGGVNKVSNTWRRIAKLQQGGFSRLITKKQRGAIIERGGILGKIEGGSTPFFLRRNKKSFKTPARPIVEPFWNANRLAARRNIKQNFKLKLAGKRI